MILLLAEDLLNLIHVVQKDLCHLADPVANDGALCIKTFHEFGHEKVHQFVGDSLNLRFLISCMFR
jgi:hypothetical protein